MFIVWNTFLHFFFDFHSHRFFSPSATASDLKVCTSYASSIDPIASSVRRTLCTAKALMATISESFFGMHYRYEVISYKKYHCRQGIDSVQINSTSMFYFASLPTFQHQKFSPAWVCYVHNVGAFFFPHRISFRASFISLISV